MVPTPTKFARSDLTRFSCRGVVDLYTDLAVSSTVFLKAPSNAVSCVFSLQPDANRCLQLRG